MELLLKWSPEHEDDTCDQHRAVARAKGSTRWGCWSIDDSRRIARDRLTRLDAQLAAAVPTRSFVYRLGAEPEVWKARVLGLAEDESLTDTTHRPQLMAFDGCFLFVELTDFEQIESDWPEGHLGLWDQPAAGPVLWASLHNQTSPLYVFELP
jgi:hypothetical protein